VVSDKKIFKISDILSAPSHLFSESFLNGQLLHTFLIHSVIGYITPVQKMTELKKVA
jgi:hypothetical protein